MSNNTVIPPWAEEFYDNFMEIAEKDGELLIEERKTPIKERELTVLEKQLLSTEREVANKRKELKAKLDKQTSS